MKVSSLYLKILICIGINAVLACRETPESPDKEPAPPKSGAIDLTHWYLTLPVDEDGDGKADVVEQPALDKYSSDSSIMPYMYDGPDSSLVFSRL